jgi:hypothetical protein
MSTYPIEKVLFEYEHGRMDVEMAMGHSLQHIAHLAATQAATAAEQQALRQKIGALESLLHSVQSKLDRLPPLQEDLTTLNRTVAGLQTQVDRLVAQAPPKAAL